MLLRSGKLMAATASPANPASAPPPSRFCIECQLTFSGKKSLRKHKQELHPPTFPCSLCSTSYPSEKGLQTHNQETHPPSRTCKKCTITFLTKIELAEHKSQSHSIQHPCILCHATFSTSKKARAHRREMHPTCRVCRQKFVGSAELKIHQRETNHLRCPECDILFDNRADHKSHARNVQHTTEYRCCDCDQEYECQDSLDLHCCDCDRVFLSAIKLESHFTNPSHLRRLEAIANAATEEKERKSNDDPLHKCKTCKEMFPSKKSLRKHRLAKHKPRRHIKCPVGEFCIKMFASPSALLSHLESGHCKSGMTRSKMTELILAHDPNHYITSPDTVHLPSPESQHAIANLNPSSALSLSPQDHLANDLTSLSLQIDDDDDLSDWSIINNGAPLSPTISEWSFIQEGGVQLTPTSTSMHSGNISEFSFPNSSHGVPLILTPTTNSLPITETIFCHLCPPTRKPFLTAERLQAHLLSPAHSPKIFYCPLSFLPEVKAEDLRKRKNFSTLSGLTQHLESGGCTGGIETYKRAIAFVEEQLEALGFGGVKLLLSE